MIDHLKLFELYSTVFLIFCLKRNIFINLNILFRTIFERNLLIYVNSND